MQEIIKEETLGQPVPEESTFVEEVAATTPKTSDNNAFIEVKFNKETKKLSQEEAVTLAQKGMKLDLIAEELEILQGLSKQKGIGLKEFVRRLESEGRADKIEEIKQRYADDSELGEILSNITKSTAPSEFEEVRAVFPELTEDALPQEVKTAAEFSGRGLLFEYLLYEHRQNIAAKTEAERQNMIRQISLGSISANGSTPTADAEFLKGVWGN